MRPVHSWLDEALTDNQMEEMENIPDVDRIWIKGWFQSCSSCPVLSAGVSWMSEQEASLSCWTLLRHEYSLLNVTHIQPMPFFARYGDQFEAHWCKDLFQVLFAIFDNMKLKDIGDDNDFPDIYRDESVVLGVKQ